MANDLTWEEKHKKNLERMEEKVPVILTRDGNMNKHDLVVRVDGIRYQVQRGKTVMVPRKVYDVIKQSEMLDQQTYDMIAELEESYLSKAKK